jgi:hypothetical protein
VNTHIHAHLSARVMGTHVFCPSGDICVFGVMRGAARMRERVSGSLTYVADSETFPCGA